MWPFTTTDYSKILESVGQLKAVTYTSGPPTTWTVTAQPEYQRKVHYHAARQGRRWK
jgi:hypothetical protein